MPEPIAESGGHVLVVGASSGIGRAVAERLLAGGARITALARRVDRLAELEALGCAAVATDVTDLSAIGGVMQAAVAERGLLTGLVYCAGVQVIKPMRSLGVEEVERLYRTNLVAPTLFAAAFGSARVSTRDAVFCAVSSVAALRPEPAIVPYAASKAGLDALIKGLARELAPRRAVGVAPGWLDTEMTQAHARLYGAEFKEALEKRSPAGAATVGSVVDAIAFLMSPQARHVTGEILRVDGGAVL
ncbi:SDR family oxidoreductase [Methylobacterium fujisawaense]|uniref:SDR family NAD(P)-dependent oxidoreductase n=1 Tax=Methylobacterium fujisawaense TaxID=107400 RepID=UPI002F3564EA